MFIDDDFETVTPPTKKRGKKSPTMTIDMDVDDDEITPPTNIAVCYFKIKHTQRSNLI